MTNNQVARIARRFLSKANQSGKTHCARCVCLNDKGAKAARYIIKRLGGRELLFETSEKLYWSGKMNDSAAISLLLMKEDESHD